MALRRGRMNKVDPFSGSTPPAEPGIYRFTRDGEILRTGETSNLALRMAQHVRSGALRAGMWFEYAVADGRSTRQTRRSVEQAHDEKHDPPLNRRRAGGGRRAAGGSGRR